MDSSSLGGVVVVVVGGGGGGGGGGFGGGGNGGNDGGGARGGLSTTHTQLYAQSPKPSLQVPTLLFLGCWSGSQTGVHCRLSQDGVNASARKSRAGL